MATEIYGSKKVEAHLASLGAYFDGQQAVRKAEAHLADLGAYFDRQNAAENAAVKNVRDSLKRQDSLKRLGDYFDSNPVAYIESTQARLAKGKVTSAEADKIKQKLQAAYSDAKKMSLSEIINSYHRIGKGLSAVTYGQKLDEKYSQMIQELDDLTANSAESSLAKLLSEYDPKIWDATALKASRGRANYRAACTVEVPAKKAELKQDNLEAKVEVKVSPEKVTREKYNPEKDLNNNRKCDFSQTRNAAFSTYANRMGIKDRTPETALVRPHAKKRGLFGRVTTLATFLAGTVGAILGYNSDKIGGFVNSSLNYNAPEYSVEYPGTPIASEATSVRKSKPIGSLGKVYQTEAGKIAVVVSQPVAQKAAAKSVEVKKQKSFDDQKLSNEHFNAEKSALVKKPVSLPCSASFPITIQKGDTITGLCRQDAACVNKVFRLNPGKKLDKIFPGDVVRIPLN